jgi:hypothetical protein
MSTYKPNYPAGAPVAGALAPDTAVLVGLPTETVTATKVLPSDSLLTGIAKLQAQIDASVDSGGPALQVTFTQTTPLTSWVITHNQGRYPIVIVTDTFGGLTEGDVVYGSSNELTLHFSQPFAGTAYLT